MPLRIFEERYRALVRHLQSLPLGQREFGVVAIRSGLEVGETPVSLYEIGCTAEVKDITEHPDGRFDLVTVGRRRFEIGAIVPTATPYLEAEVTYLPEQAGPDADALAPRVLAAFRTYLGLLRDG